MTQGRRWSPLRLRIALGVVALAIVALNLWGVLTNRVESPILAVVIAAVATITALVGMRRLGRRPPPDSGNGGDGA